MNRRNACRSIEASIRLKRWMMPLNARRGYAVGNRNIPAVCEQPPFPRIHAALTLPLALSMRTGNAKEIAMRRIMTATAAVVAIVSFGQPAAAWWDEGHMQVAAVAYDRLTPAVRSKVDALIK